MEAMKIVQMKVNRFCRCTSLKASIFSLLSCCSSSGSKQLKAHSYTGDEIQMLPDDVSLHDRASPTQELERELARLQSEEAASREHLVLSLVESRKRVQEATDAWEYHERLASAYRGTHRTIHLYK